MVIRRKFSKEFKLAAVARVRAGDSAAEVARALEINPNEVQRWGQEWDEYGDRAFQGFGHRRVEQDHTAELERKIGQQALEIDFLRRALQRFEQERRSLRAHPGGDSSTSRSKGK
jgi:transposase-like protein